MSAYQTLAASQGVGLLVPLRSKAPQYLLGTRKKVTGHLGQHRASSHHVNVHLQEPVQPGVCVCEFYVGAGDAEPVQGVPCAAVGGLQLAESLPGMSQKECISAFNSRQGCQCETESVQIWFRLVAKYARCESDVCASLPSMCKIFARYG
jgi:hypothetical protein